MKKIILSLCIVALTLNSCEQSVETKATDPSQEFDLVILNGRVIDPETNFDAVQNVGIKDGEIAIITTDDINGKETIDASNQVVSPGFIDIHAHGQNIGDYRMQAMQGVTTMLELESGVLPVGPWYESQASKKLPLNYGTASGWTYARIATFSDTEPEATVAYFQNAQKDLDWKMNIATPDQEEQILRYVEDGLNDGALGIGINAGLCTWLRAKRILCFGENGCKT
jgi:N-acyl-D-glutamate deacylase